MCILFTAKLQFLLAFSDHMQTYASEFVSRYARLSSLLEVDLLLAQQATRQVDCAAKLVVGPL